VPTCATPTRLSTDHPERDLPATTGPAPRAVQRVLHGQGQVYGTGCGSFDSDHDLDVDTPTDPFLAANGYNNNSQHVLLANGTDSSAILDGFRIIGGNATAATLSWAGHAR